MPSYLWSGKDTAGNEVTDRVDAASPEEAREKLLGRGWADLKLHTSEVHGFVKEQIAAASDPAYRPKLTPAEELAYLKGKAPGFWLRWWKTVKQSGGTYAALIFMLGWAIYRHRVWGIVVSGGLLVILSFIFPVLHVWFSAPRELFERLHRARNWRRWTEVLTCLEALQRVQRTRKIGIGAVEMARYRALALAGSGSLEEADDLFTKAAEAAKMPRWLFYSHLANIHTVAERYDQALEFYRQGFEVATEKGTVCIDYGSYLVQRFNRPAEARELLKITETVQLPELAKDHLSALRAMIAVREGDFETARRHMSEALAGFEERGKAKYFIFEPSILLAHGYLALIEAALGDKESAEAHFAKSEKYLETLRMDELIRECREKIASVSIGSSTA